MLTRQEIDRWLKEEGLTRKQLAQIIHVNYSSFCAILTGKRMLSEQMAARIEDAMNTHSGHINVSVPEDIEEDIKRWAEEARTSIDQICEQLLSIAIKLKAPTQKKPEHHDKE